MGTGGYSNGYYYISFDMWEASTNAAANTSNIGWALYIVPDPSWYNAYWLDADVGSWSVSINGQSWGGGYNFDFRYTDNSKLIAHSDWSGQAVQGHNTNGSGSSSGSASTSDAFLGDASAGGSCGLTDFVRVPSTPSYSSGPTRTVRTVGMTLSTVTNYGSSLNYYVDYSKNGGGYEGQKSNPSRTFSFPNLDLGASYVFRGYAADSEGTGGNVTFTVPIPNVPSAPTTCTVSAPAGRSVTVTSGTANTNGAAITGYYAQQSADNGVTWKNAAGTLNGSDPMTSQEIVYNNLVGGATYKFRVYAANEMGSGTTTTSGSVFVPSGGKRFDPITETFINASTANRRNESNTGWTPIATTKKYVVSGAITNAVGNGSSVTYTTNNAFSVSPANKVTITGVTPSAYNLVNAVVTAATSTSFTVASSVTGTYSSSPGSQAAGWMEFV